MNKLNLLLAACFVLAFAWIGNGWGAEEQEEKVALDQVPAAVKDAAVKAVDGLILTEAEKETEDGVVVYELDGTASGKEYEVKVSADGKVLKVEEEEAEKEEKAEAEGEKDDDDGDDEEDDDDDGEEDDD